MIYLFIVIYLLWLVYIFDYKEQKGGKKFWYVFTCIILILLSGLRYRIGGDTLGYMDMYEYFPTLFTVDWNHFNTPFQPLWTLFVLINKTISPEFAILQFTHAIILNVSLFTFIKKRANHQFTFIFFYFLLYYFLLNFEVLRESLAVAFFLIGFKYFESRKWLLYYLFALISFGFHVSAIFLFFLPLLRNIKLKLTNVFIILFILSPLFIAFFSYFAKLTYLFDFEGNFGSKMYDTIEGIQGTAYNLKFRSFLIITNVVLPFLFLLLPKFTKIKYKMRYSTLYFLYLFIACLSIMSNIFIRLLDYVFISYIIFLSDFIILLIRKYKKTSLIIFFSITLLLRIDILVINQSMVYHRYFPYYSIITKQTDEDRESLIYFRRDFSTWW